MLLKNTDDRTVEGNLQGRTYNVGISDMRLIIDRLTDMYADRETTCIREYVCNARDAHIEAGITSPVEVTTPGPLAPFLTIRDYGVGLTEKDIEEIYSQYGASTKRSSNDQTGAFGLGCKSALAYSDQFTVTSIKDGIRIQVVVSRDPKEGVTMKVVDTSTTSDPNGTTVMIPAKGYNQFDQKAKAFFKYWPKGTVKLNGIEPEFMPDAKKVTDTIYLVDGSQSYVVMGGVPYPANIDHGLGYYQSVIAFVPIGSVDPKPDREALIDTDETTTAIQKVSQEFRAALKKAVQDDIETAGSPAEAAIKRIEWYKKVGSHNMPSQALYKGRHIPDSFQVETETIVAARYASKMNAHTTYRKDSYLPLPTVNGSLWVTGFDYASFTATVKKKLDKYVSDNLNGTIPTSYILTAHNVRPASIWIKDVTFVDWPTIKAIKLPRNVVNPVTGRIPGSYDIFEDGDWNEGVPGDDIDTSHDVFWMEGTRYYHGKKMAEWLSRSYPGSTLVMLRSGREDKFQRNFPKAKNADEALTKAFKAWVDGLDKDDVAAYYVKHNTDSRLKYLDESRVDDPSINHVKSIMSRDTSKLEEEIKLWATMNHYYDPETDATVNSPLAKYPLLPESYYFDRHMRNADRADHVYRYMNSEYAFQKAAGN